MHAMRPFTLWHSVVGAALFVALEAVCLFFYPAATAWVVSIFSAVGAFGTMYVATEVVEEIHHLRRMILLLVAVIAEFIALFAFQYHFLAAHDALAFPAYSPDALSAVLQSLMVFVFNPISLPADAAGKLLLIINTLAAIGLVLFILQNISQLRHRDDIVR